MSRKIRLSVIMTLMLGLSACSTTQRAEPLSVPTVPSLPPDSFLEPCPKTLQTLPEGRAVGQTEAWQTVISWAEDYHQCKDKHTFLSGWVAGQAAQPKPSPQPEPKPSLWERVTGR